MFIVYLEDTELPSEIEFLLGRIHALFKHKMTEQTFWKKLKGDLEILKFGTYEFQCIHTPGHTTGGCCFLVSDILFSGDTLFPGGPGSTSFGGDEQAILSSIREKLLILPDKTKVYPGHGPSTTIGQERGLY